MGSGTDQRREAARVKKGQQGAGQFGMQHHARPMPVASGGPVRRTKYVNITLPADRDYGFDQARATAEQKLREKYGATVCHASTVASGQGAHTLSVTIDAPEDQVASIHEEFIRELDLTARSHGFDATITPGELPEYPSDETVLRHDNKWGTNVVIPTRGVITGDDSVLCMLSNSYGSGEVRSVKNAARVTNRFALLKGDVIDHGLNAGWECPEGYRIVAYAVQGGSNRFPTRYNAVCEGQPRRGPQGGWQQPDGKTRVKTVVLRRVPDGDE